MRGKAFKQVVRGRVIQPAVIRNAKASGRPFLSFSLAVDGLLDGDKTGFINCTYHPYGGKEIEKDVVACALSWISKGDQEIVPVTSEGFYYKSVEVTVEGQLSLRSDSNDPDDRKVYVNLQFCNVDIHDREIVKAVKSCLGLNGEATEAANTGIEQPTVAPSTTPAAQPAAAPAPVNPPVQQAAPAAQPVQQAPAPVQEVPADGTLVESSDGNIYKVVNGQYVEVGKVASAPAAPVATPNPSVTPNTLGEVLQQGTAPPNPKFS